MAPPLSQCRKCIPLFCGRVSPDVSTSNGIWVNISEMLHSSLNILSRFGKYIVVPEVGTGRKGFDVEGSTIIMHFYLYTWMANICNVGWLELVY